MGLTAMGSATVEHLVLPRAASYLNDLKAKEIKLNEKKIPSSQNEKKKERKNIDLELFNLRYDFLLLLLLLLLLLVVGWRFLMNFILSSLSSSLSLPLSLSSSHYSKCKLAMYQATHVFSRQVGRQRQSK